jgi:hypothetical protein
MTPSYAIHYSPPRPPVLFRFRSAADRDTYVAEFPYYRRAYPEPPASPDWVANSIALENGTVFHVSFRMATLDDLMLAKQPSQSYNATATP